MESKYSEDNEFDDFMQGNDESDGPSENIVNVLQSMNIVSDEERESIRQNLGESFSGESGDSLAEGGWAYYAVTSLNVLMFFAFGKMRLVVRRTLQSEAGTVVVCR